LASDQELADFLKSVERRAFKRRPTRVRDDDAALDIVQDAMIRLAEQLRRPPGRRAARCCSSAILSNAHR
jgi:RNA polymerase sigma-70 factor (ECF subfamily)